MNAMIVGRVFLGVAGSACKSSLVLHVSVVPKGSRVLREIGIINSETIRFLSLPAETLRLGVSLTHHPFQYTVVS